MKRAHQSILALAATAPALRRYGTVWRLARRAGRPRVSIPSVSVYALVFDGLLEFVNRSRSGAIITTKGRAALGEKIS